MLLQGRWTSGQAEMPSCVTFTLSHVSRAAHSLLNMNRLDRAAISVGAFEDQRREDYEYWMSRPARERFLAIEKLRLAFYGESALRRFDKVIEVSHRGEG